MLTMLLLSVLVHLFHMAAGVIYHLNETDHKQMPSIFTLDEYNSCLADTGGTYCVAQFELHSNPDNYLLNLIKEYSEVSSKHYNYSRLYKGICVTKSCINFLNNKDLLKSEDLRLTLEECINDTMFSEHGLQAKLNHVYHCDRYKEENTVDLLDRIVAALCLGLLFVNIVGTFAGHVYKENLPNFVYDCLSCFSIQQNWKRFRDESTPDQYLSLKGLHGARSITMLLIVYSHTILLIAQYTKDTRYFEESYDHKFRTLLFSGLLLIQIFFGISGFLAAYLLQVKSEETDITWIDIPKIIFLRWWRFTPVNGLLIAFIMTWLRHLGSGPLWKLYVSDCPSAACRQHWWMHLLYINNYVFENLHCVFHTWYLAADMQLLILGLVVHVATRRRGRALALGILTVIGTLAPVLHVWLYDLDPQAMLRPEFLRTFQDDTFRSTHIQAHSNMVCFIMGMAAGYLGYYLQKRGTDLSRNKICRALTWLVIPAIIGLMYHSSMYFADEPRASVASRMLQAGAHRPIIGILAATWSLAMICKCNDASKTLFEWRGWELTSKLSFCVYLVHIIFVYVILGLRKEVISVSFLYMVRMTFLVLGMSFLVALPLHLMVEVPFNRLLKMLFINHAPLKKKL